MRKTVTMALFAVAFIVVGCRGQRGEKGDAGVKGDAGTAGERGMNVYESTGTATSAGNLAVPITQVAFTTATAVVAYFALPSAPNTYMLMADQPTSGTFINGTWVPGQATRYFTVDYSTNKVGLMNMQSADSYKILVFVPSSSPSAYRSYASRIIGDN